MEDITVKSTRGQKRGVVNVEVNSFLISNKFVCRFSLDFMTGTLFRYSAL